MIISVNNVLLMQFPHQSVKLTPLTHSPLFYFSGGGDFHAFSFFFCLFLIFYV